MAFSIFDLFSSFVPGSRLVDGGDVLAFAKLQMSSQTGITAGAGGGLAKAFQLSATFSEVDTVATGGDSVALPPAIPGIEINVNNNGANSMNVFGNASNFQNGGAADLIIAHNGLSGAAAASQAQGSGVDGSYKCYTIGLWKQNLSS